MIVNKGQPCADSTTSVISVYPGFVPFFSNNSPSCVNVPVQFRDLSTHRYGVVNGWRWDFGDGRVTTDTSTLKNPTYAYSSVGTYITKLIVKSNRGCEDTFTDTITIVDKPAFVLTNDTLICSIDTLQLNLTSSSLGSVSWTPNYNINNTSSFNPLVSPDVTTKYIATFRDNFGCVGKDSVTVNVVSRVTLQAGNDTTICRTDSLKLPLISDALKYSWTPAATLNDPTLKNPSALPVNLTTTYKVTGSIGNCSSTDQITVKTVPYPIAKASADTSVCFNTNATLRASGGSIYAWRPVIYLSSPNSAVTQVINPQSSINYIVSVSDTLGCPKVVKDTVLFTVIKINADAGPRDTSVVLGQPLQLFGSGGTRYEWTPATYLNNSRLKNPLSQPENNIQYELKVSDNNGCIGYDSISVRVFFVEPDLYVPSAFTPDKDGLNETFKPIPLGMKSLDLFKVFNRWGQLIYSSTNTEVGWDGKFKGTPQSPGTFVWIAEGVTYLGKKISKKGSVILIR
ncbi:MAG: PKD domain-containing protein [Ferruginibacter sp.]